jgi:hypothetical protein
MLSKGIEAPSVSHRNGWATREPQRPGSLLTSVVQLHVAESNHEGDLVVAWDSAAGVQAQASSGLLDATLDLAHGAAAGAVAAYTT